MKKFGVILILGALLATGLIACGEEAVTDFVNANASAREYRFIKSSLDPEIESARIEISDGRGYTNSGIIITGSLVDDLSQKTLSATIILSNYAYINENAYLATGKIRYKKDENTNNDETTVEVKTEGAPLKLENASTNVTLGFNLKFETTQDAETGELTTTPSGTLHYQGISYQYANTGF